MIFRTHWAGSVLDQVVSGCLEWVIPPGLGPSPPGFPWHCSPPIILDVVLKLWVSQIGGHPGNTPSYSRCGNRPRQCVLVLYLCSVVFLGSQWFRISSSLDLHQDGSLLALPGGYCSPPTFSIIYAYSSSSRSQNIPSSGWSRFLCYDWSRLRLRSRSMSLLIG